jgi:hypothetical protein
LWLTTMIFGSVSAARTSSSVSSSQFACVLLLASLRVWVLRPMAPSPLS